jgi:parallel beta-helix repeat protein
MKSQRLNTQNFSIFTACPKLSQQALAIGAASLAFLLGGLSQQAFANPASPTTSTPPVAQVPLSADVIHVNPGIGSDAPGAGNTTATPYRTITYALQQVKGSSTVIQLAPGSYTEQSGEVFPLILKPGVILRGDESNKGSTVVIIGGGFHVSPSFARQSVTILADRNTEVRGVTVTNPRTRGTGVWIESTNPTIRNSTFTRSNRDGIFVTGTGNPKIENNVFTQNSGNGISVARGATGEIRNNLFQNTGFGIAIGGTSSPLISGNQITQNTDGVYINDSASPVLRNNVIQENTRDGVVATISAQPDLGTANSSGNNIIRNNARYDLNNATRNNTIVAVGNDINVNRISGKVDFVAAEVAGPLRDIQGHWAQAYIEALAAKKIITGFPDGTFRPTEPVTRVQFAAIINKAFSPPAQRPRVNFQDVSTGFWGYDAIQTAYQGGFLSGYPGNVFEPEQQIPRVQVLVSLASGLNLGTGNASVLSYYTDAVSIPDYAKNQVAAATQRQIVVNYPTTSQLNPNRPATRAEVAAFVYQALVSSGRADAIPSPYVVLSASPSSQAQ